MVDWEEVWEDFDLKRGIIILTLGILVIVAGVFVMRDYFAAQRLDDQLTEGLGRLDSFYDTFKPSNKETSKMQEDIQQLKAQIESQPKILLNSEPWDQSDQQVFDLQAIEAELRRVAQRERVKIKSITRLLQGIDGYLLIHPLKVEFEGTRVTIPEFIYGIREMKFINELKSERIASRGSTVITASFFSFDVDGWREGNPCQTLVSAPAVDPPELDGVYIFKGNLATKRTQLMDKKRKLEKELKQVVDTCEIEKELKMLKDKLSLIQEMT